MVYVGEPRAETLWCMIDYFEDEDLMQYTGLKDGTWKEIYVGDILAPHGDKNNIAKAKITSEARTENPVHFINFYAKGIPYDFIQDFLPDYYEIIWNIYENPDLLLT